MAETGAGEMEISPLKSLQKGIKREAGNLRKAFAVTGMARRTTLPPEEGESQQDAGNKLPKLERTLDERAERGEMYRIIKRILKERSAATTKEEKGVWNQRFHAAVEISRGLRKNLDTLNRQYYDPNYSQFVDVDILGEQVGIPVRRYSLRDRNAVPEGKVPPPVVIIGGATSGPTVTKGAAEAFALQYPDRDVYVIGYPNSLQSRITEDLPGKMKEQGTLVTYAKLNKDVLLKLAPKMGFESFDLVGTSMGGGIILQAATDPEFAKRINNLIVISPTSIQETKIDIEFKRDELKEVLNLRIHPKQWARVPQEQPGYKLGSHEGMGIAKLSEIARQETLSVDDLAKLNVQGRVIIATGEKDDVISCEQVKEKTGEANEKRIASGEKPIEFMQVKEGRHGLGVVNAPGIVALIKNTNELPNQINVNNLPATTAEVFVRKDPRLAPVENQILK